MSTKYATSLRLEFKPSQLFSRLAVSVHSLAFAACLANALPLPWRMLGVAAVALSLLRMLKQNYDTTGSIEIAYSDAGGWTLCDRGATVPIVLLGSTVSVSWIILLHYRIQGKRGLQVLPIFRDAIASEDYRKLKVLLRIATPQ